VPANKHHSVFVHILPTFCPQLVGKYVVCSDGSYIYIKETAHWKNVQEGSGLYKFLPDLFVLVYSGTSIKGMEKQNDERGKTINSGNYYKL
jgi:hypothetical protein